MPLACLASLAGYAAVVCVLALIQHHGTVLAECVKSLRKVLQVRQLLGTACARRTPSSPS